MNLPSLLIEEIFEYLLEEEIIYLRKVSKLWNAILSKRMEFPLYEDEAYLQKVGKYVKRVIKPSCTSDFLRKIVKYCPNLEYIFILNNPVGYELLKLLNARRNVKTKLRTVRVMTDKTNLYSFGLNQDVKDLLMSIQDLGDLAPDYLPTCQPKYSPSQFWRSFPNLEKLVLFGGPIDFPSQDVGVFQRLTKLELCYQADHDENFHLPPIPSLQDVSISFACENFIGESFSCRLIMPSPVKVPNLKRLHLAMETISVEVSIQDANGNIKAINPSDHQSHFTSVRTLELIGFLLRPSEFQQLFPNCQRFEADFSSFEKAKVYTNPMTSILKLVCQSKTASTLAFFVNPYITSVSVSENLVLWALYFLPNLKHLEIIGQEQHYLNHDMFKVGKKPSSFDKLVSLEWLYTPGIIELETLKSILTVAPNLKAIFSSDHRPHGYFVRSTRPRVKLCDNLRFSAVSGLMHSDSQDSNTEMLSLMLGR